jgi:RNA polymerase sigma factor (sigma-70 family)
VQTTFLQAFRAMRRGTIPHVERAWLIAIAQNVCRTMQRSASRRRNLETDTDPELAADESNAAQPLPDEIVGLEQALARIPANQRRALVLREWNGLRYHEIADVMGMSQSAVEMLAFRARRSLSEALSAERQGTRLGRLRQALDAGGILSALRALLAGGSGVQAIAGAGVAGLALATFGATHAPGRHAAEHSRAVKPPAVVAPIAHSVVARHPTGRGTDRSRGRIRRTAPVVAPQVRTAPGQSHVNPSARSSDHAAPAQTPASESAPATAAAAPAPQATPGVALPQPAVTVPTVPQLPAPATPQVPTTVVDLPSLPVTPPVSTLPVSVPQVTLPTP